MKTNSLTFKPINSLFSNESIKQSIQPLYQLSKLISVTFLQSGVNDTYLVSADKCKYIFRLYRVNLRSHEDIQYEMDFLSYLFHQGISVSSPIKNKNDELVVPVNCPEGLRYGVLFSFAEGEAINYKDDGRLAQIYGESLAQLHLVQKGFSSDFNRSELKLDTLVHDPLTKIKIFFSAQQEKLAIIEETASFVLEQFSKLPKNVLTSGTCHGDTHCGNAHIDGSDLITYFDFDCCGQGWLEYDLATFYWGSLAVNKKERWQHFLKGYTAINKDYKLVQKPISLLMAMRQLWLLGLHYDTSLLHGGNWYNNSYFERHTQFFTKWKTSYLEDAF